MPSDISFYGAHYPQSILFGVGLTLTSIILILGTFLRYIQIKWNLHTIRESEMLTPEQREFIETRWQGLLRLNLWMARFNVFGSVFLSLLSIVSLRMSPPVHSLFALIFFAITIGFELSHSVLYRQIVKFSNALPRKGLSRVSLNHRWNRYCLYWYIVCNIGTLLGFLGWTLWPVIVCERNVKCSFRWPASVCQMSAVFFILLYYIPFGGELFGVTFGDVHRHWCGISETTPRTNERGRLLTRETLQ